MKRMAQRRVVLTCRGVGQGHEGGSSEPVSPASTFSHFGRQCKVLLSDGLVVLQDPLEVGHRLVAVLRLYLLF